MKKYEYKVDVKNEEGWYIAHQAECDYLKQMGDNGWELVSVHITSFSFSNNYYYWKREILTT